MKASNSRFSHRPEARYSNLAQVQGGMITDADLTEAGQIHQTRDEVLGGMALASGVPATDGMVSLAAGVPGLRSGRVVAGGRAGRFMLSGAGGTLTQVLAQQADLPEAPALPAGPVLLYADLWDRVVQAHEDPRLTDAGLHGAVTSYRTRTMVQVKALPLTASLTEALAMDQWRAGGYPFLATGTARAEVAPNQAIQAAEDCDPCATSVELAQVLPNALFRGEILEVSRNAAGQPLTVRLAWSMENAETLIPVGALADQTARDAFARVGAAYEWLNLATEAHLGFLPGGAKRPAVTSDLTVPVAMVPAPTHVRRWDGSGLATLATAGAVVVTGGGALRVVGGDLELTVDLLRLTIRTNGQQVQAGDHWLVELRRHAAVNQRLHLVGANAAGLARSQGPDHRFCPLYVTTANVPAALDDATRRRLSFPALNDLPADHVSFAPECEPLFGNAKNVQEALRALCSLNAGHVAYTPNCPDWYGAGVTTVETALDALCNLPAEKIAFTPDADCPVFQGATNVAEALERLCEPGDSALLRLVLKSMMDWGVICGLVPARSGEGNEVRIGAGVALDRDGRIAEVAQTTIDLNDRSLEGSDRIGELVDGKGEVCLVLRLDKPGVPRFALVETAKALLPTEPTMQQAIANCRLTSPWLWQGETLRGLTAERAELLRQVNVTWVERERLDGYTTLSQTQAAEVDGVVEGLVRDYATLFSAEAAEVVTRDLRRIDDEIVVTGLAGTAADQRRMSRAVAKIAVLERNEALSAASCVCRHAHTPCAPDLQGTSFVPLGCLTFVDMRPGRVLVDAVCTVCCRKQAMTWRSWRYYNQPDFIQQQWNQYEVEGTCCVKPEAPPSVDWGKLLDKWRVEVPPYEPPFVPTIPRVWPPKGAILTGPDLIKVLPDFTRLRDDDAKRVIEDYGVSVVETLDLSGGGSLSRLAELQDAETIKLDYGAQPQPGDRVVLLTDNGRTVGSVTIGRGEAPLPFARTLARGEGAALPGFDLAEMTARTEALKAEAEASLADLARARTVLMQDVAGLKAEVAALAVERRAIGTEVLGMRDDQTRLIAEVTAARDGLVVEVQGLKVEIDGLVGARQTALAEVAVLKAEQAATAAEITRSREVFDRMLAESTQFRAFLTDQTPLTRVAIDPAVVTSLTNAGVATLGEAERLTDAQMRRMLGGTSTSPAELRVTLRDFRNR
jgi:hypothetical protein